MTETRGKKELEKWGDVFLHFAQTFSSSVGSGSAGNFA